MRIIIKKEVKGKRFCDGCRNKTVDEVRECLLPYNENTATKAGKPKSPGNGLWYDLCPDCIQRVEKDRRAAADCDFYF